MRRLLPLLLLLFARCTTTAPELGATVDRIVSSHPHQTIAVSYYDFRDGSAVERNAGETFHAASTMKVPVMLGIFEAITRGELTLDQLVPCATTSSASSTVLTTHSSRARIRTATSTKKSARP